MYAIAKDWGGQGKFEFLSEPAAIVDISILKGQMSLVLNVIWMREVAFGPTNSSQGGLTSSMLLGRDAMVNLD